MTTPITHNQALATLVLWLAAVAIWLIFSPGIFWILDVIANGVIAHG